MVRVLGLLGFTGHPAIPRAGSTAATEERQVFAGLDELVIHLCVRSTHA
jgi:hypothetical protein